MRAIRIFLFTLMLLFLALTMPLVRFILTEQTRNRFADWIEIQRDKL